MIGGKTHLHLNGNDYQSDFGGTAREKTLAAWVRLAEVAPMTGRTSITSAIGSGNRR